MKSFNFRSTSEERVVVGKQICFLCKVEKESIDCILLHYAKTRVL